MIENLSDRIIIAVDVSKQEAREVILSCTDFTTLLQLIPLRAIRSFEQIMNWQWDYFPAVLTIAHYSKQVDILP